jgi:hypothetical protein
MSVSSICIPTCGARRSRSRPVGCQPRHARGVRCRVPAGLSVSASGARAPGERIDAADHRAGSPPGSGSFQKNRGEEGSASRAGCGGPKRRSRARSVRGSELGQVELPGVAQGRPEAAITGGPGRRETLPEGVVARVHRPPRTTGPATLWANGRRAESFGVVGWASTTMHPEKARRCFAKPRTRACPVGGPGGSRSLEPPSFSSLLGACPPSARSPIHSATPRAQCRVACLRGSSLRGSPLHSMSRAKAENRRSGCRGSSSPRPSRGRRGGRQS